MMKIRQIDLNTFERKEHFDYYTNKVRCGYSFTFELDVTNLYDLCKKHSKHFYGMFIYIVSKTVNSFDFMKYVRLDNDRLGVFDEVHPVFTVFHKDDETFSDIWCEYKNEFNDFYEEYEKVMHIYGQNHGIKGRSDQPRNFFCISCIPWLDFTGYSTYSMDGASLFPIITYGKFKKGDSVTMPFTISISHAACDGYHIHKFMEALKKNINSFEV